MQFHLHANQSRVQKNGFALRLALKQRHKGTLKWPILMIKMLYFKLVASLLYDIENYCGPPNINFLNFLLALNRFNPTLLVSQ